MLAEEARFKKTVKSPAPSKDELQSLAPGGAKGKGARSVGRKGKGGGKGGKSTGAVVAAATGAPA